MEVDLELVFRCSSLYSSYVYCQPGFSFVHLLMASWLFPRVSIFSIVFAYQYNYKKKCAVMFLIRIKLFFKYIIYKGSVVCSTCLISILCYLKESLIKHNKTFNKR